MKTTQVYFVGAGPGDPGLLTVRAKEVLSSVDVVLYDRLVSRGVLNTIPKRVRKIDVGKKPYSNRITQSSITKMMILLAENGKTIARLKGGDSLFFSRGSEEAIAMKRSGIRFEIVPGVSSVMGATAYAGLSLTHRDYSSSVLIATGQEGEKSKDRIDWKNVPKSSVDTIVLLMAVQKFPLISRGLIDGGLDPHTPVAAVEWGTTSKQKARFFSLNQAGEVGKSLRPPSIIVIGKVVELAKELRWAGC